MRRVLAWLAGLVTVPAKPRRSSGEVHWQVQGHAGSHAAGVRRSPETPQARRSPMVAVSLTRAEWVQVSAIITWQPAPSPVLTVLQKAITAEVWAVRDPAGAATAWDLGRTDRLRPASG